MFNTFIIALALDILIIVILAMIYRRLSLQPRSSPTQPVQQNILDDYSVIARRLKIEESIDALGMFQAPYEDFIRNVETEIRHLQNWRVEGIEGYDFTARVSLLKFALNMAIVYAEVMGHHDTIPKIREYLRKIGEI